MKCFEVLTIKRHANTSLPALAAATFCAASFLLGETTMASQPAEAQVATHNLSIPMQENRAFGHRASDMRLVQTDSNQSARQSNVPSSNLPSSSTSEVPGAKQDSEIETLDEVTVTAQKRKENLKDVPISISVLSGAALERPDVQGVQEILGRVPGVSINSYGTAGTSQVTMRGASTGGPYGYGSSTSAYYLDGVPFGWVRSAFVPDSDPYDLNSIEVLRGPQGTLYGANALNGVVRVLTKGVDLTAFDFKARIDTSATDDSNGLNYGGDVAVNVPIVKERLAARAVASYSNLEGWIDSPAKDDVNDSQRRSYRLKLAMRPRDDLMLNLSAWHSSETYGGAESSDDGGEIPYSLAESNSIEYDAYNVEATYNSWALEITSNSSYLDFRDQNNSYTSPSATLDNTFNSRIFSQELILRSALPGPWRWSIGGFYRESDEPVLQDILNVLPVPFAWTDTSRSWAAFGELSRRFADDRLELTLGTRYFRDKVRMQQDLDFFQIGSLKSSTGTYSEVTPRAVLTWFSRRDFTAYMSYSEGFRSGAPQVFSILVFAPGFPDLKPDKLKNYEIGGKGELLNGRISFDMAMYYMDWRDVQQQLTLFIDGNYYGAPVNGKSASGVGVDLSLTTTPVRGVDLGINLSWNDLTFDSDIRSGSNNVILYPKGARLDYSPEYTLGTFGNYVVPFGRNGLAGRLSASANYVARQTRSLLNVTQTGVNIYSGDQMLLARASLSLEYRDRWSATLFANNVSNSRRVPLVNLVSGLGYRVRPQTVGIQFDYRY